MKNRSAATIVEMLVVLAAITLIVCIVHNTVTGWKEEKRIKEGYPKPGTQVRVISSGELGVMMSTPSGFGSEVWEIRLDYGPSRTPRYQVVKFRSNEIEKYQPVETPK